MKVTALLPDQLVEEVKAHTHGKNITDALIIALEDWVAGKRLQALNRRIDAEPLQFTLTAREGSIRELNRRRRR